MHLPTAGGIPDLQAGIVAGGDNPGAVGAHRTTCDPRRVAGESGSLGGGDVDVSPDGKEVAYTRNPDPADRLAAPPVGHAPPDLTPGLIQQYCEQQRRETVASPQAACIAASSTRHSISSSLSWSTGFAG